MTQRAGVGEDRFEGQSTGEGGLREKKWVESRMNSISLAKTFFLFCLDERCGEDRERGTRLERKSQRLAKKKKGKPKLVKNKRGKTKVIHKKRGKTLDNSI